jgi:hypothetical protein
MWGRGSSAAAGALARYREGTRARERIREARLAEANRQAGARPHRHPPAAMRPLRPPPPRPVAADEGGMPVVPAQEVVPSQESERIRNGSV